MTYNGWTNYETWVVKRWLDNDESTVELQRELLKQARHGRSKEIGRAVAQYRPGEQREQVVHNIGSVQHELAALLAEWLWEGIKYYEWVKEVGAMKPYYQEVNFSEIAESIITETLHQPCQHTGCAALRKDFIMEAMEASEPNEDRK